MSHCGRRWDVPGSKISHETCQQHMVLMGALEETEALKREEKVECIRFYVSSRMFIAAKLGVLIGRLYVVLLTC
jgi:hypothetical protein